MQYNYDVFVSYRRYEEWPRWVRDYFMPLFKHWLGEELGRSPEIFVDYDIKEGYSWPHKLAMALSTSKVMVALWTPTYFNSMWCKNDLAHMYAREVKCGYRTLKCSEGLIIPVALHDGERFPQKAREIQMANLQKYANVRIARNSKTAEELSRRICNWVPSVAHAIGKAPPFNPLWKSMALEEFLVLFTRDILEQRELPSLG